MMIEWPPSSVAARPFREFTATNDAVLAQPAGN